MLRAGTELWNVVHAVTCTRCLLDAIVESPTSDCGDDRVHEEVDEEKEEGKGFGALRCHDGSNQEGNSPLIRSARP